MASQMRSRCRPDEVKVRLYGDAVTSHREGATMFLRANLLKYECLRMAMFSSV